MPVYVADHVGGTALPPRAAGRGFESILEVLFAAMVEGIRGLHMLKLAAHICVQKELVQREEQCNRVKDHAHNVKVHDGVEACVIIVAAAGRSTRARRDECIVGVVKEPHVDGEDK